MLRLVFFYYEEEEEKIAMNEYKYALMREMKGQKQQKANYKE